LGYAYAKNFQNVCIKALAYVLPDRVVRSDELEQQLAPIYAQLGRSIGRLEQMTGVQERRFGSAAPDPARSEAKPRSAPLGFLGLIAERFIV
jgi:3-oxoacyl-[acyl-carrier-protein] synthase-3